MKVFAIAGVVAILLGGVLFVLGSRRRDTRSLLPAELKPDESIRRHVEAICAIGERNVNAPENLAAAANLIERELSAAGHRVERQTYRGDDGTTLHNLIAEVRGRSTPAEVVVVGAHYDSVPGTVGADDNASGVAALLALARRFASHEPARTLRFVAFVNEEPPHFQTHDMGSWQYARRCRDRGEQIVAMISIETVGYFDDRPGSQQYPAPLGAVYPDVANFIGFASNPGSRALTSRCVRAFRASSPLPVESAVLPQFIPGIAWSDQWSFWQFGWPAVMVTDTALFRNPHYHRASDTPATLDYGRLSLVVAGLQGVIADLAQ